MAIKMDRHSEIFKVLLLSAFLGQVLVDGLGMAGVFYESFGEEVFRYAGTGSIVSFGASFSLYLFFMVAFYTSIVAMSLGHWLSWLAIPLALGLSFISQPLSGVYIGTPAELTLSWIAWFSYDVAIAMVVFSPSVSNTFKASFRDFYSGQAKP